jgi:hypothetical protein
MPSQNKQPSRRRQNLIYQANRSFMFMDMTVTGDAVAPTCVITADAADITPAAFTCTFTFSESVTGFTVGDITVGNGSAGSFAGSGAVYTAVITPTATGTVTVDVGAGVCVDAANNANTAALQFSIVYVSALLYILNDGLFYQDAAKTTPAVADGDPIGNWEDQSGNGRDFKGATTARPALKLNVIGSLSGVLFDGGTDTLAADAFATGIGTGVYTLFMLCNGQSTSGLAVFNRDSFNPIFMANVSTGKAGTYDGSSNEGSIAVDTNPHVLAFRRNTLPTAIVVDTWVDGTKDGTQIQDNTNWTSAVLRVGSYNGGGFFAGYIYGAVLCAAELSDGVIDDIIVELKKKLGM